MATKVNAPLRTVQVSLSDDELRDLWRWLLWRQGIGRPKFDTAVQVADATLGLHAARLSSPFVTILARSSERPSYADFFSKERAQLVTVRCMRKTLHMLPLPLAAMAHSATMHFRERDAMRRAVNESIGIKVLDKASAALVGLLEREHQLSHRELEARLASEHIPTQAVRLALKIAWERGLVTYRNTSGGWNSESRQFALTSILFPGFELTIDRQEATNGLVYHYFDRYGPASIPDMMWWSGLSRGAIVRAMNVASAEWVSLTSPWGTGPLFMLPARLHEFYGSRQKLEPFLNLLSHEDAALKAYFETRKRYLGSLAPGRIFNQIGEVLPSIVQDGQVVGQWHWDIKGQSVRYVVFSEHAENTDRNILDELAERYTHLLKAHTAQ